jgi:hypothetical protein
MKLGKFSILLLSFVILNINVLDSFAEDKIGSVPLINLEDLSPTFEESKDELEKLDEKNSSLSNTENSSDIPKIKKSNKVLVHLKALDKITAKTSEIELFIGENKFFGQLEIKALKCQFSKNNDIEDTVAYLQVKDLSALDNNQVYLFNGWTFASSPTLQSIDHPVYDLWITSCENI